MKKLTFVVMMLLSVFSYVSGNVHAQEKPETRPNILLIHTDDVGWGDYSIYNSESKIKTPEIDRLAKTGIRFTNAHTPAALCAPTRYALLTGNYPWRGRYPAGDWNWHTDTQFLPDQKTFGHFLQQAGYRTAMFGKANLGLVYEKMIDDKTPDFASKLKEGPIEWGFDYSYIIPRGHMTFPYVYYENNILVGDPKNVVTLKAGALKGGSVVTADGPGYSDWNSADVGRTLTEKVTAFIDDVLAKNKAKGKRQPFLIHFNTDGAHTPHTPTDVLFDRKLKGETITPQTDMILETEIIAGQLVKVLKERNLYANTIIIVTSDNGGIPAGKLEKFGHDAVGGLRGNKSTIWEGGTRVPFIVHWGDDTEAGSKIKPGTTTNQVIGTHDLAATFAEIAGVEPGEDQALDSVSFLPVLLGKQSEDKPIRESLLVQSSLGSDIEFPFVGRVPQQFQNRPQPQKAYKNSRAKAAQDKGFDGIAHAVLKNHWKLLLGLQEEPQFLVNLKDDPKETTNLLEDSANKKRIEEYQTIYKSIRESKRSTPPLKL
ncbi:MAG: sulfatase-like hydrolase/transferase [Planctomycetaceae bacterium]|jgi:arylsulfatase A-like enzyme|nr:sulfatase-like hydrolase/transferase [Planctomycetaceae bacterium]